MALLAARDLGRLHDPASVLALNVGSAGVKAASYARISDDPNEHYPVQLAGRASVENTHGASTPAGDDARNRLAELVRQLPDLHEGPDTVVHRIVHGGDRPGPAELTPATRVELQGFSALAPLHQPPALALVRAAIERWPDARQIAVFDTSWHQTMAERHRVFPLPYALYSSGVKRYGFHGLAFQSAMRQLGTVAPELSMGRLVLAHLGGGSSLCAVRDGACVNTTMGMTPLGGIAMASRSGSLDPGVLLHLQRSLGMSEDEIDRLLWHESGLKGLSGESGDMRKLLVSASDGARLAVDVYVSGVVQGIAAMAASNRGVDALVFSGGIGANAAGIRARVTDELAWMGLQIEPGLNQAGALEMSASATTVRTFALPVDEETEMVFAIAKMQSGQIQPSHPMSGEGSNAQ